MKLNNKGLTLVEIIVAFVILVMFLFGMLGIVMAVKEKAANELLARDTITFKETLTKAIQDDLIKISLTYAECSNNTCELLLDEGVGRELSLNLNEKEITYNGTVYELPMKDRMYFGTVKMAVETIEGNKKILIIDIPFYEMETTEPNYGIKIAHPYTEVHP